MRTSLYLYLLNHSKTKKTKLRHPQPAFQHSVVPVSRCSLFLSAAAQYASLVIPLARFPVNISIFSHDMFHYHCDRILPLHSDLTLFLHICEDHFAQAYTMLVLFSVAQFPAQNKGKIYHIFYLFDICFVGLTKIRRFFTIFPILYGIFHLMILQFLQLFVLLFHFLILWICLTPT